ncbi:DUF4879 domain-containing protein [Pseudomonas sp. Irchel 3E20]|uniref:DUF4879 domain-containing protein n=1 Tax=Pseudomonas sp. Irchel 3E20 TaxID=2008983 RepID=UPI000BA35E18
MNSIRQCLGAMALAATGLWVSVAVAAPAAPLSHLQILRVESPACGFEDVSDGRGQTRCDHGGGYIRVYVIEQGYGRGAVVTLDGAEVDGTRSPVCADARDKLGECPVSGAKVVGYLYVMDLSGARGGSFSFSNTSINVPGNTLSAELYIR